MKDCLKGMRNANGDKAVIMQFFEKFMNILALDPRHRWYEEFIRKYNYFSDGTEADKANFLANFLTFFEKDGEVVTNKMIEDFQPKSGAPTQDVKQKLAEVKKWSRLPLAAEHRRVSQRDKRGTIDRLTTELHLAKRQGEELS